MSLSLQTTSTVLSSQATVPLMPDHLVSAVLEYHQNRLSSVEMDELLLDNGDYAHTSKQIQLWSTFTFLIVEKLNEFSRNI